MSEDLGAKAAKCGFGNEHVCNVGGTGGNLHANIHVDWHFRTKMFEVRRAKKQTCMATCMLTRVLVGECPKFGGQGRDPTCMST